MAIIAHRRVLDSPAMKTLCEIDILDDDALRGRMVALGLGLLVVAALGALMGLALGVVDAPVGVGDAGMPGAGEAVGLVLAGGGGVAGGSDGSDGSGVAGGLAWVGLVVGVSLAALPAHEMIHGMAFLLLGPRGTRVRFGHERGMLYATAPGAVLARWRFVVVLLAPSVALTLGFAAWGLWGGMPLSAWVCLWVHLSGCVGDLLMVREIRREPTCSHVRDTPRGIVLLAA